MSSRRSPALSSRRRFPINVIDEASEIELIDLAPDELLQRLKDGKVYVPEQAAARSTSSFARAI